MLLESLAQKDQLAGEEVACRTPRRPELEKKSIFEDFGRNLWEKLVVLACFWVEQLAKG